MPPGGQPAENPQGAEESKQLVWSDDADGFIFLTEAIAMLPDEKATLHSAAGKRLKPDGSIRYMRKGRRTKVQVNDWMAHYGDKRHPPGRAEHFDSVDVYVEAIEKGKAVAHEKKRRNE